MSGISNTGLYLFRQAVAEAQRHVKTSIIPTDVTHYEWRVSTSVSRKGQTIDATWSDGEYLVQIRLPPVGFYTVSVAELTWVHCNSDEQCACEFCVEELSDAASSQDPETLKEYFNTVVQDALKDIRRAESMQHLVETTSGAYAYPE